MIDLLLDNLGLVIDADGEAKRIRDTILQLAFRGQLVAQDPKEGEWSVRPLTELVRSKSGNSKIIKGKQSPVPVPSLVQGYSASGPDVWVKEAEHSGNGIVVSAVGARCGKAFLASGQWTAIANTHAILPSDEIDINWLFLLLNNEHFWIKSGSAQPFVKVKATLTVDRSLPPLAEQHRIVAKVDELMEHVSAVEEHHLAASSARVRFRDAALHALAEAEDHEAVERAWSRIEENFDDLFTEPEDIQPLRQTILQLAVRGRLVAHELRSNTAKIRSLREDWTRRSLGELAREMNSGWSPRCDAHLTNSDEEWGVLKTTAVQANRFLPEHHKALPKKLTPRPEHEVRVGDVLITRAGPSFRVGVATEVAECRPRLMLSDKLIRVIPDESVVFGRWMALCVNIGETADFLTTQKTGMDVAQMNISQKKLRDAPIPLPPLAEQHRIIAKVDELMALCDTLETSLERAKSTREQFANSISSAIAAPAAALT